MITCSTIVFMSMLVGQMQELYHLSSRSAFPQLVDHLVCGGFLYLYMIFLSYLHVRRTDLDIFER